jgi:hypothetical protein
VGSTSLLEVAGDGFKVDLVLQVGKEAVFTPPPPRTKWTRRVPHPVLIGHAASLSQVGKEAGSLFSTKTLTVLPRYVVCNRLSVPIEFAQAGAEAAGATRVGRDGGMAAVRWLDEARERRVRVRLLPDGAESEGGDEWEWSGALAVDAAGYTPVKVRAGRRRAGGAPRVFNIMVHASMQVASPARPTAARRRWPLKAAAAAGSGAGRGAAAGGARAGARCGDRGAERRTRRDPLLPPGPRPRRPVRPARCSRGGSRVRPAAGRERFVS